MIRYDLPWMLHNVVPWGLMGGTLRHDRHHQDGRFYYQKFFTYLDDAIGTTPPIDTGAEHDPLLLVL